MNVDFDIPYSQDFNTNSARADGDYGRQRHGAQDHWVQSDGVGNSGRRSDSAGRGQWKGQRRDGGRRDPGVTVERDGGAGGVVLPLDMVGSGVYDV